MSNVMKAGSGLIPLSAMIVIFILGVAESAMAGNRYKELDKNKDGIISRSEATTDPNLFSKWDRADINNDYKVDEDEFARFAVIDDLEMKSGELKK